MLSSLTMKTIVGLTYIATTTLVVFASVIGGAGNLARRDTTPGFELDPLTTEYCIYYWDTAGDFTCDELVEVWGLTMADFTRWNPSITPKCGNFKASGRSYCVAVEGEPLPTYSTTSTSTITPTTTTAITSPPITKTTATTTATTTPGNGIQTPTPYQAGISSSCNRFHFVEANEQCGNIAAAAGISLTDFYSWNSGVGSACGSLWQGYYVYTGIIGSTPTNPGNGVTTPLPIQPGMTTSCNKFRFVKTGDQCGDIAAAAGISLADFYAWNPSVGTGCSSLFAESYVCIGLLGCQVLSPPPSGQHCGRIGIPITLSSSGKLVGYAAGSPYVASVAACAAKCLDTPACENFYITPGSDCTLYYGPVSFSPNGNAGSRAYYQQSCFKCPPIDTVRNTCPYKSPAPSGDQCGRIGVPIASSGTGLLSTFTTGSPYVTSNNVCAAKCLSTPACTGIFVTPGSYCSLRYGPVSFSPNGNAGSHPYYQTSCFECASKASCAMASPPPSGLHCGRVGVPVLALGSGLLQSFTEKYTSSLGVCAAGCADDTLCSSFYFKQGVSCDLHFGAISFSPNGNAGSSPFYDIGCFPSCK
ncbi:hypothetical protein O988_09292 [Pseudogymnoascus sp. VKM F-3808]|nr:hypothetical protein O988_09292 [Pseudogymnoascus sp. VKM F-3808]